MSRMEDFEPKRQLEPKGLRGGCVADPTLRPSMSGVAARVRDIAQSREIQLSLRISNLFGIILKEVKGDSSKYLYIYIM